jgi:glutathione S-transferase
MDPERGRLAYQVRLLDTVDQQAPEYRTELPFGQVPVLEEDGRPPLFENRRHPA